MKHDHLEPPALTASPWSIPENPTQSGVDATTRHDGWTGERMAKFCEALAETGLVVDACLAAGKSTAGAYALRRRVPVFAAAWEAALTIARERLADTLLARSIEGTVEQYYKDGELVGEKRVIDNRLGLAILRRLDRMAETGSPLHSSLPPLVRAERSRSAFLPVRPERSRGVDWDLALSALRSGEPDAVAEALAMFQGPALSLSKGHEVDDPPNQTPSRELCNPGDGGEEFEDDGPIRIWSDDGVWFTDFAPPPAYKDYEKGQWGDHGYKRTCSVEESRLLDADKEARIAGDRAEDEAQREAYFAELKADLEENGSAE